MDRQMMRAQQEAIQTRWVIALCALMIGCLPDGGGRGGDTR
jgi:hypothetical protein